MALARTDARLAPVPLRAALYLRISKDTERRGLGVARQERDLHDLIARNGWTPAATYVDNDRSATRKAGVIADRPDYRRLLADIAAGRVDAVVSWELDRLVRDPLEHEEFLIVCERSGMHHLATLADEVDIQTGEGLMVARIKAAVAAEEVRKMSKRIRRKKLELAEAGRATGGPRPYGYEPGGMVLREDEAERLREAARRVLAGRSLGPLIREWNAAGVPGPRGGVWRQSALRQMLLKPRLAGLRVHQGAIVGDAEWPPVLERSTWEAVVAVLESHRRATFDHPKTYLLTRLIHCGAPGCGHKLSGHSGGTRGHRRYVCPGGQGGCGTVSISAAKVETLIVDTLFAITADDELRAARQAERDRAGTVDRAGELSAVVATCDTRLKELARSWAEDGFSREEWLTARRAVEERRQRAVAELVDIERDDASALDDLIAAGTLADSWPTFTAEEQRALLAEAINTITVAPIGTKGGRDFDPTRVDVDWKV